MVVAGTDPTSRHSQPVLTGYDRPPACSYQQISEWFTRTPPGELQDFRYRLYITVTQPNIRTVGALSEFCPDAGETGPSYILSTVRMRCFCQKVHQASLISLHYCDIQSQIDNNSIFSKLFQTVKTMTTFVMQRVPVLTEITGVTEVTLRQERSPAPSLGLSLGSVSCHVSTNTICLLNPCYTDASNAHVPK